MIRLTMVLPLLFSVQNLCLGPFSGKRFTGLLLCLQKCILLLSSRTLSWWLVISNLSWRELRVGVRGTYQHWVHASVWNTKMAVGPLKADGPLGWWPSLEGSNFTHTLLAASSSGSTRCCAALADTRENIFFLVVPSCWLLVDTVWYIFHSMHHSTD